LAKNIVRSLIERSSLYSLDCVLETAIKHHQRGFFFKKVFLSTEDFFFSNKITTENYIKQKCNTKKNNELKNLRKKQTKNTKKLKMGFVSESPL